MIETLFKSKHTEIVKETNGHEMIQRPVAVAIMAYDSKTEEVIMVKQVRGHFGEMLEVPAGKVDKGEKPIDAVRRELLEETGYKCGKIIHLISYFPSVGYSTEEIKCYMTEELTNTSKQRLDDNEHIEVIKMSAYDVFEMIRKGEIKDSKTIMCMSCIVNDIQVDEDGV